MKTRIHLSIMQPQGYVHSQGFLDQARYARYQFRRLGAEVTIGKNRLREDSINIIFGAHLGFPASLKKRYTCIFFNLEQLGEGGARVGQDYIDLLSSSAVIDYDARNLPAYNCKHGDVPVVEFLAAPYLANTEPLPLEDRPIDLLFFGSMNDRRRQLFARIEACGVNVSTFDQPLYSEERDHFIRQAKAVLNCHFYESSRFEQARAFHTLSLGTPLISERTELTTPPAAYEDSVSWFDDLTLEEFFQSQFLSADWINNSQVQLSRFRASDEQTNWRRAYDFGLACRDAGVNQPTSHLAWTPSIMNLGSGKDYRLGWLNIDILARSQPDVVLDLGQPVEFPIRKLTQGGGHLLLEEDSLDSVYANNVLEHVPDLPCLMTNLLRLLKENGVLEVEVPYEKSLGAWQDPTHLRAMNINSWIYYTDWFWYLGWFSHRFEVSEFSWLDSKLSQCNEAQAEFMRVKLRKIPTTAYERSVARTTNPGFCSLNEDYL